MSASDFRETSCNGPHWYQLCQSLNLGTIGVGLCLVASLKILVKFFTKSLVSYVAQDMPNILLCKNQVDRFCRHPPECFPALKYKVFVLLCPVPTCTSWDKRLRMNPELQDNLNFYLNLTITSSSMIQLGPQNSILIRSLEKLQIGTHLLEMGRSIKSEA